MDNQAGTYARSKLQFIKRTISFSLKLRKVSKSDFNSSS